MPRLVRRMPLSMEEGGMGDGDGDEYDGQRPQAKVEGGFSDSVGKFWEEFRGKAGGTPNPGPTTSEDLESGSEGGACSGIR
jgi:hypothetical protein